VRSWIRSLSWWFSRSRSNGEPWRWRAPCLATMTNAGKLILCWANRTGFTHKSHLLLRDQLVSCGLKLRPLVKCLQRRWAGAKWVSPNLVSSGNFATWTKGQAVRQAASKGSSRRDNPAKRFDERSSHSHVQILLFLKQPTVRKSNKAAKETLQQARKNELKGKIAG